MVGSPRDQYGHPKGCLLLFVCLLRESDLRRPVLGAPALGPFDRRVEGFGVGEVTTGLSTRAGIRSPAIHRRVGATFLLFEGGQPAPRRLGAGPRGLAWGEGLIGVRADTRSDSHRPHPRPLSVCMVL